MKQTNFKEIYDEIYENIGQEVEKKRKNFLFKSLLFLIIDAVIIFIVFKSFSRDLYSLMIVLSLVILFIAISWLIILRKISKDYTTFYKEKIIYEIAKKSNPTLKYFYKMGIPSTQYAESHFDNRWDIYNTEDLIEGQLEDGSTLKMGQVHTEREYTSKDSDGRTTRSYETTFFGLYGIITLKALTDADFMIRDNSKLAKFNKNRIEMESAEFEKYYDVYSKFNSQGGQRQSAMEILTPETIEEFVKIRNMFKKTLNVRVYGNKIYFRIWVKDIFEPPTFRSSLNFDMLYRYFLIIDVPRMLYEALIDNILLMYGSQEEKQNRLRLKAEDKGEN